MSLSHLSETELDYISMLSNWPPVIDSLSITGGLSCHCSDRRFAERQNNRPRLQYTAGYSRHFICESRGDLMFYNFNQNNSGGYFTIDDYQAELVIIEAENKEQAVEIFNALPLDWNYCNCCGLRWDPYSDWKADEFESPTIGVNSVYTAPREAFLNNCRIHFLNGRIEAIDLTLPKNERVRVVREATK